MGDPLPSNVQHEFKLPRPRRTLLKCALPTMRMMLLGVLAAADGVVDLRPFEREVLPRWVDRFALDFERGAFAFAANDTAPALYGVLDATHLLASVGRLDAHLGRAVELRGELVPAMVEAFADVFECELQRREPPEGFV